MNGGGRPLRLEPLHSQDNEHIYLVERATGWRGTRVAPGGGGGGGGGGSVCGCVTDIWLFVVKGIPVLFTCVCQWTPLVWFKHYLS